MKRAFLLIGEEHSTWSERLEKALSPIGKLWVSTETAFDGILARRRYDVIFIDCGCVPDVPKVISRLKSHYPEVIIIAGTDSPTWRGARDALRSGAANYLRKSMDESSIREEIRQLLESHSHAVPKHKEAEKRPIRILIADNSVDFSKVRAKYLERQGYTVLLAVNPIEARKLLESGTVDLALLDVRMTDDQDEGDVSGLTLARTVAPSIPKIMLTGFATADAARESIGYVTSVGMPAAVDFLSKNDGAAVMVDAVSSAIVKFIRTEGARPKPGPAGSDSPSLQKPTAQQQPTFLLLLRFVFLIIPKAVGRFILDLFDRDKATDTTAVLLGYIAIALAILVIRGMIKPDLVLNTFRDTWKFFFPLK